MPTNRRRLHKASGVWWGGVGGVGGLNCNHMTQPCPTGQQMPVCMLMVEKKKKIIVKKNNNKVRRRRRNKTSQPQSVTEGENLVVRLIPPVPKSPPTHRGNYIVVSDRARRPACLGYVKKCAFCWEAERDEEGQGHEARAYTSSVHAHRAPHCATKIT